MMKMIVSKRRTAMCAVVALLVGVSSARADIIVTGNGKVVVVPDIAFLALAVVTDGPTAAEAMDANSEAVRRLFAMCKSLGIDERDVQTSSYSIQPKYRYPKDAEPVLIGYTVSHQITVKVRKLSEAGKVIDSLVKEGANRVQSITFAVSDPQKAMDEARAKAMADALRKAEIFAKGGKVTLGQVKSISEQQPAPPMWRFELDQGAKGSDVPLAPGEKELDVHVTVVFKIADSDKK